MAAHGGGGGHSLGLYGWRKRCLFVLICALISLIVTNLALTLWILKVMEFSAVSLTRSLGVQTSS